MASDFRRSIEETVLLHSLEPTLKSIYVEGSTDKAILDLFVSINSIECNVYEINSAVDFSEQVAKDSSLGSNRNKLILFSTILAAESAGENILCVIDRDFDDFLPDFTNNIFLFRSDYSCIEAYILNNHTINKILKIGFANFPLSGERVIQELIKFLPSLFFLRLLRETEPDLKFTTLIKTENIFSAGRDGLVAFNLSTYIERFCNKNAIRDKADYLIEKVSQMVNEFNGDIRNVIHGHDFVDSFFRYVNIVKNTNQFKEATFEKAIFIAIETRTLIEYTLFSDIQARFISKQEPIES